MGVGQTQLLIRLDDALPFVPEPEEISLAQNRFTYPVLPTGTSVAAAERNSFLAIRPLKLGVA